MLVEALIINIEIHFTKQNTLGIIIPTFQSELTVSWTLIIIIFLLIKGKTTGSDFEYTTTSFDIYKYIHSVKAIPSSKNCMERFNL